MLALNLFLQERVSRALAPSRTPSSSVSCPLLVSEFRLCFVTLGPFIAVTLSSLVLTSRRQNVSTSTLEHNLTTETPRPASAR